METKTSKSKEIRIPGPDHPITISLAEGRVRGSAPGRGTVTRVGELRKYWDEINNKLLSQFATLSEHQWLQRHNAVSEEDYATDPARNRLFC